MLLLTLICRATGKLTTFSIPLSCFLYSFYFHTLSDTLEGGLSSEQRSVMSGGTVRGWLPDVAVVLWRRVLGLLGDPNDVASPQIHAQIFKYLTELMETLVKVGCSGGDAVLLVCVRLSYSFPFTFSQINFWFSHNSCVTTKAFPWTTRAAQSPQSSSHPSH